MFCFLETPVLTFALLPYYRRDVHSRIYYSIKDLFWSFLRNTAQKMSFSINDLFTFTEEILDGKHFFVQWK